MMAARLLRSRVLWALMAAAVLLAVYSRLGGGKYEYEEVIALELDGSATVDVNASPLALSAMHGVALDAERPQLDRIETLFSAPGVEVSELSTFRRRGRRFVHVSLDVADIRRLPASPPFAGSAFRLDRQGDTVVYRQHVRAAPSPQGDSPAGTPGGELAAIRVQVPSRVLFENATSDVERGNILVWEHPLADRLNGVPLDLRVEMENESILYSTLLLFGATIALAAATFAIVIALVVRKGRRTRGQAPRAPAAS